DTDMAYYRHRRDLTVTLWRVSGEGHCYRSTTNFTATLHPVQYAACGISCPPLKALKPPQPSIVHPNGVAVVLVGLRRTEIPRSRPGQYPPAPTGPLGWNPNGWMPP